MSGLAWARLREVSRGAPITALLGGLTLLASLLFGYAGRRGGFGALELVFVVPGFLQGQLWRIATFPFVVLEPFSLILALLFLWLFGAQLERRWGSGAFFRFYALSSVGAALASIPLYFLINLLLPMNDSGVAQGPTAALDAMLVAVALLTPDATVLFGFALPVKIRVVVLLLLGFQLIAGIMSGVASLGITLGGMLMGYLLVTGVWRPRRLIETLRVWRLGKKRRGLHVVPRHDKHTLH